MAAISQGVLIAEAPAPKQIEELVRTDTLLTAHIVRLEDCKASWAMLEPSASPYQRYEWITSYIEAIRTRSCPDIKVIELRNSLNEPVFLLPVLVENSCGLRIARPVGGKHANFHMALCSHSLLVNNGAARLLPIIRSALRQCHADLLTMINVPEQWDGEPNPIVMGYVSPSPSNAYKLTLETDVEATLKKAFSKDSRKKLRQKLQRLSQMGAVSHLVARTEQDVHAILTEFYRQKAERFARSGLKDPFADHSIHGFLEKASLQGLSEGKAALELHALKLDERIIAIIGGAVDARRFSGMFMSFDMEPDIARNSPGDLLVQKLVEDQVRQGRQALDFGVGEARYKSGHCDEVIPLVDVLIATSVKGHVFAKASQARQAIKRWIKQTPWAYRLAQKMMPA